jgi:hypothetical protein
LLGVAAEHPEAFGFGRTNAWTREYTQHVGDHPRQPTRIALQTSRKVVEVSEGSILTTIDELQVISFITQLLFAERSASREPGLSSR